ncbi:hypothetical protein GCM10009630_44520 [Kribbella jejuensis]|uniref:Uncharacterized protein n=1 Tax=Kribbella jejuensis TaxID=236068 RepID=A0A542EUU6_9ACTN|nr:hypothetical protein [Kribbella jejuensis]TQJ19129.1 hypothetical protein FB475_3288 [Kribbella jejuensis]
MALIQGIPGEFDPQPWGEAILRSRELLLLRIARRPPDHEVRLPGLATSPRHVVEDHTGKALTWRRDGADLVVRLPETGEPPVVRVALAGKLRIVPQDTVTANADGVWDLTPTGPTAHLVARRAADVAVRFVGMAEPDSRHQVRLAGRRYGVTGHELTRTTIGPFPMPDSRVVPLAVPAGVRRVLVAPVGTVLASIHPGRAEVTVVVTNFGRTTVRGEVELPLPAGWSAAEQTWTFDGLEPGRSIGWVTPVAGAGAAELRARLEAGRRSASSPYVMHL